MSINIQIMPELCKYKEIKCIVAGKPVYYGSCLGCKHEGTEPIQREHNETPAERRIRIRKNRRRVQRVLKRVSSKPMAKTDKTEEELLQELFEVIGR